MRRFSRVCCNHQFNCLDLRRGLYLAQVSSHIRRELVLLEQCHRLRADPVQKVDPAVDGREVNVEGPREPFLSDALVNCAAQHVMLLHRREPIDPVVADIGLKILSNQAGRGFLGRFDHRKRFFQSDLPVRGRDLLQLARGHCAVRDLFRGHLLLEWDMEGFEVELEGQCKCDLGIRGVIPLPVLG